MNFPALSTTFANFLGKHQNPIPETPRLQKLLIERDDRDTHVSKPDGHCKIVVVLTTFLNKLCIPFNNINNNHLDANGYC